MVGMAKFCANISFMFLERPFLERYQLAKNAGFKAVESGFPYGLDTDEIIAAKNKAGIDQVLLNIYTGMYYLVLCDAKADFFIIAQEMSLKANWVSQPYPARKFNSKIVWNKLCLWLNA